MDCSGHILRVAYIAVFEKLNIFFVHRFRVALIAVGIDCGGNRLRWTLIAVSIDCGSHRLPVT